ncbi:MAG: RNA-binding S4 domain-containing protein [Betaproteobacteria bacterium]|jgi:ribosome-associated heat shock protein Hsp15
MKGETTARLRLDKWLWAARFFKTRALATDEIDKGRVRVNEQVVKPARELKVGDLVELRQGVVLRTVVVRGLSAVRGPAPVAQALYEETPASIAAREAAAERRRLAPEPASALVQGRPTKRDRRQLTDWTRWSASLEDEPGR